MSKLKDIFFPMAKALDALEEMGLNDLDRIKQNNYQLTQRLNEMEKLENEYPMKTYHIEVISGGVIIPYTIEARSFDYSGSGTYYFYNYKLTKDYYREREILAHFPIDKTIIKKIEIKK